MKLKSQNSLESKDVLAKHSISRTKFRTDLLNLFYTSKVSLSIKDIMTYFNNSINKVTVYRSLESFEKKGLIHQVPGHNNLKRYSLCSIEECAENIHNHNHGHFICNACNKTFCLEEMRAPEITCIKGFYVEEVKLVAEGYCQDCYKN